MTASTSTHPRPHHLGWLVAVAAACAAADIAILVFLL